MMQQENATSDDHHHAYMGSAAFLGGSSSTLTFPNEEVYQIPPWTIHDDYYSYNNPIIHNYPSFNFPPPQPPQFGSGQFNIRRLQFGYEGGTSSLLSSAADQFISDHSLLQVVHPIISSAAPFDLQADQLQKMNAQEIMDAKAIAASRSHSEAERKRRERINNHLAKLRSLLPNTTKTDKASLLAEVIQHVKELKRQTSLIAETSNFPTETDELVVDNIAFDEEYGSSNKPVIKASICCEDRSDLLPELIKTLKSLKLKTLKAEIITLGGRVKNVLFITIDDDDDDDQYYSTNTIMGCKGDHHHHHQQQQFFVSSVQEALKTVMEKSNGGDNQCGSGSSVNKRQRTNITILN